MPHPAPPLASSHQPRGASGARTAGTGLAAAAVAGLGYSLVEARSYRLRRVSIPVLAPGSRPLRVLHISDLHVTPRQRGKQNWIRRLAGLDPDLVVDTGDHMAHRDAVPAVLHALQPLLERPGVFVPGSNDYYAPMLKNPARYLLPRRSEHEVYGGRLPWPDLRDALVKAGWLDLTNAHGQLEVDGRTLAFAGVDDPHLRLDRLDAVAGAPPENADLAVGVAHAPYQRVLDAFMADGYRLLLAGHTHGGQLCVPGWGALVTNCDLEPARASGLSRHPAGDVDGAWLHVSEGLGTSPYTPVRFACPPSATLLTLVTEDRLG